MDITPDKLKAGDKVECSSLFESPTVIVKEDNNNGLNIYEEGSEEKIITHNVGKITHIEFDYYNNLFEYKDITGTNYVRYDEDTKVWKDTKTSCRITLSSHILTEIKESSNFYSEGFSFICKTKKGEWKLYIGGKEVDKDTTERVVEFYAENGWKFHSNAEEKVLVFVNDDNDILAEVSIKDYV